jgi:hypothetical protein
LTDIYRLLGRICYIFLEHPQYIPSDGIPEAFDIQSRRADKYSVLFGSSSIGNKETLEN